MDVYSLIYMSDKSYSLNLYLLAECPINCVQKFRCVMNLILSLVARKERQGIIISCGSVEMIHLPSLLRISVEMRLLPARNVRMSWRYLLTLGLTIINSRHRRRG